jgi:ParB family chromosome partitioning protein
MKSKQRLGRGLGALLPADNGGEGAHESNARMMNIQVELIEANPFQPRMEFDQKALNELKESIRSKGVIQPISVRRLDNGKFQLVAGERRLRAVRELGIATIPAYILDIDSNEDLLEIALIENIQREYLNPIETALGYQRLIEECNLTQEDVAKKIGKDRTTITNFLRLLKLPRIIQDSLQHGEIAMGHARALLALNNEKEMIQLWKKVVEKKYSVRQVERAVKEILELKKKKSGENSEQPSKRRNIYYQKFENMLREKLGTKVKIKSKKEGGSIEIEFYSKEDLQRLIELFDEIRTV